VAGDDRPSDLRPIPWETLGDSRPARASGDLILQVCGDDLYVCEHLLRRAEEELGAGVRVAWTQIRSQRYTTRQGRTSREEGRALIGFLDGSSNLNPRNVDADRRLVFVDPAPEAIAASPKNPPPQPGPVGPYGGTTTGPRFPADLATVPTREPQGTHRGPATGAIWSCASRHSTRHRGTTCRRLTAIGRFKVSGASLDLADETRNLHADPAFAATQADTAVAVNAYVRKANPRRSQRIPRAGCFGAAIP
jgi:deferrochelatase/peroxidase EfeB